MKRDILDTLLMEDIIMEEGTELIPILSPEDEEEDHKEEFANTLPILPIRNTVLFPGVVIPITVGRKKSIKLVKDAYKGNKTIGVITQVNPKLEDPASGDLFKIGTIAKIIKMLVLPDGNTTIIIQGKRRFRLDKMINHDPYFMADISVFSDPIPDPKEKKIKAIAGTLKETAEKIIQLNPEIPQEAKMALDNIESASFLTHFLSSNLNVEVKEKQNILEIDDWPLRATKLLEHMNSEVQLLEIKKEIHSKVHSDLDQQQRDYFLRQQMKVLQDELGQEGPEQEIAELRLKAEKKKWPEKVKEHFFKELDKLQRINPAAAEYPVSMNYAELLLELPWDEYTEDNFDLKRAEKILDKDHYGLEKVKERIVEYLAVLKLKKDMKAPILCLYGPPGVGKTSLGKSIAKALDREYVRMSLGGLHDEAEIRGHRKTYIGAMPGKIIQNIKKAKSANPVFVLDEIDKVGSDFKGDPSSALLEVLDPEQNNAFNDNYLEVEFDLSKVLFVATANSLESIQPALRDRMEIIEVNGYSIEEKIEIAKRHLLPKLIEEHGLKKEQAKFSAGAIKKTIEAYTRESGVRGLEKKLGGVIRKIAKAVATDEEYDTNIKETQVIKNLGPEIFEREVYTDDKIAGVTTGLAWTSVGGDILYIESNLSRGKGKLTLSGQLGDVMKESAITALSYLKANADVLSIDDYLFTDYDLHIHFPEGAVPKDGPSAGITILTALASLYTQRRVLPKLAMTGEITLRGKVLPVGGIKEKILAAKRAGIKEIIMCSKNRKDIDNIKEEYIKGLNINFVDNVNEVIKLALLDKKVENEIKFSPTKAGLEK